MAVIINKEKPIFFLLAALFVAFAGISVYSGEYLLTAIPFVIIGLYAGWQNRNLVFLILLFSLPFSFEYHFTSELGTDLPDEFIMIVVSGLFIAYWIYYPEIISKKIILHPLLLFLIFMLGWTLISILFSTEPLVSLKFLLAKGWYTITFVLAPLIIFKEKKLIKTAAITVAGSMLIVTVISLLRHYEYGFRFANINDAVYPFFRNHVNYSAMLVCIIPILFSFFIYTKDKKWRFFTGAIIIVFFFALAFSYARGAWLALLVGLLTYWLIKNRLLIFSFIVSILILLGSFFWLKRNDNYLRFSNDFKTTIFHKNFAEHLVATYKLKDISTAERFYRWIAGVRMIKDNWMTGYGPNTFYKNYKKYAVPAFRTWVSDNKDHSTVHNYFLLTVIEQGIPGLLLFILLLGAMLYYAQYLYHRVKNNFYKTTAITTGIIVSMIIAVNFLSDLIETDKIGSLFFLCIAVLVVTDVNTRNESNPASDAECISQPIA
ncbi:MAG: O-antigen ligase family protein [Chitinophagaceae bacterium]